MSTSASKKDWEDFRAIGKLSEVVRGDIMASWQRSAAVAEIGMKRAPRLNDDSLNEARRRAGRFALAARPAMQKAGHLLSQSGSMILLCNALGVVIDQLGDPATLSMGQENNLHDGGCWSERDIGTNAIGMALQTGLPSQVLGPEHYCEEIHRWSCAATPVCDPVTGRLLGVIDVSWPSELGRGDTGALSVVLGLQAETMLRQQILRDHERLSEIGNLRRLRQNNTPMALLDRYGAGIFGNDELLRFFDSDELMQHLRAILPDLFDQSQGRIEAELQQLNLGMDVEIVQDSGNPIGLLLSKRNRHPNTFAIIRELDEIGSVGEVMGQICAQAHRLAQVQLPLLIEGEAGAGKSTLAAAIHQAGPDAALPFERLDCSAVTADTLRADLTEGGLVDQLTAKGGILCLEGPGSTTMEAQKLLLALVEKLTAAGMRVISLSVRSLLSDMNDGKFRSDLYFRLAAARLTIPPLRERRDEILPHLQIIRREKAGRGRNLNFTNTALNAMSAYHWPGNLREMANLVELLQAISPNGLVDHRALPNEFHHPAPRSGETLRDSERLQILDAIDQSQGNLTKVARRLGIARSTLYLKMDAYGIAPRKSS